MPNVYYSLSSDTGRLNAADLFSSPEGMCGTSGLSSGPSTSGLSSGPGTSSGFSQSGLSQGKMNGVRNLLVW